MLRFDKEWASGQVGAESTVHIHFDKEAEEMATEMDVTASGLDALGRTLAVMIVTVAAQSDIPAQHILVNITQHTMKICEEIRKELQGEGDMDGQEAEECIAQP